MKYPLTEAQIERFRLATPLQIDEEPIAFTIFQNGKSYHDIRGKSQTTLIFNDFSCNVDTRYPETKEILNRHYLAYKAQIFGEEFVADLKDYLDKKSEKGKQV